VEQAERRPKRPSEPVARKPERATTPATALDTLNDLSDDPLDGLPLSETPAKRKRR
jgi:hypothetical protein